jgi:hypothetical protein
MHCQALEEFTDKRVEFLDLQYEAAVETST